MESPTQSSAKPVFWIVSGLPTIRKSGPLCAYLSLPECFFVDDASTSAADPIPSWILPASGHAVWRLPPPGTSGDAAPLSAFPDRCFVPPDC
jgi:hypothetical protein